MFRFDYCFQVPAVVSLWLPAPGGDATAVGLGRLSLSLFSWTLSALVFLACVDYRALVPQGWLLQWHCGVRVSSNKKLVGFISAIPAKHSDL